MSDRPSPFDVDMTDPAAGAAPAGGGFSLLGMNDPTLSLLGNLFSGGRVGADQIAGTDGGGSQLGPVQRRTATDALMAAGATLANAGAARFGPQPTWAQALTGALAAGSSAGDEAQTRAMLLDQSQRVLEQSAQDAAMRRAIALKQMEQSDLAARVIRMGVEGGLGTRGGSATSPALQGDTPPPAGAAMPVAPGDSPGAAVRERLAGREGNYSSVNGAGYSGRYQFGTGLLADSGMYTPAQGEDPNANSWAGRFNIPGHPEVQTRDDFLRSPAAQDAAYQQAMSHNDQQLAQMGVYDRAAQQGTIGGVPVTREGLLAAAWLGGVGGVRNWVDSNGRVDQHDSNRTRVSEYAKLGVGLQPPAGGAQVAAADTGTQSDAGPAPAAPALPPDQQAVAATGLVPLPAGPPAGAGGAPAPAPLRAAPAGPPVPAPAPAGVGGGLPPTPVPPSPPGAAGGGGPFQLSQQQWAALALTPYGKQGEALAKMLDQPGGETKTIEDPNTHVQWMWRTDRQGNPVARIGLAPTDPKHVNALSADGTQLEIHTQLPGGGLGPLVGYAPHEVQMTEVYDPTTGQNLRGAYIPGQGFRPIGPAPLSPEALPKTPQRVQQNVAEAGGIAGATEDERNARKAQVDLYAGRDRASQMRTQLDMLDALQDPQGKFRTGALTAAMSTAGGFAAALGVPLGSVAPGLSPDSVVNAQTFQKITNGLALSHIGPGGLPANTFSEADRNFVSAMGPQLTNAPASNRLITGYMRATNERQLEQANRWDAWQADPAHQAVAGGANGAQSWRQFQTEWNKYAQSDPVVQKLPGQTMADRKAAIEAMPAGRLWYYTDDKGVLRGGLSPGRPVAPQPPPGTGY